MKIISYNVNGIRAAIKKGFIEWLQASDADVVCIQETKAQSDQIPVLELKAAGYDCYDFSAKKKGYSGVAILSKIVPDRVVCGMGMEKYDNEGRFIRELQKERPNLVLCGDYNICHREIDIHDPVRNATSSGFLPEEREWMSRFLDDGFTDSFRFINGDLKDSYSWWSYRAGARGKNKGWRIDYCMVSNNIRNRITNAGILSNVFHSDHCPISLSIE